MKKLLLTNMVIPSVLAVIALLGACGGDNEGQTETRTPTATAVRSPGATSLPQTGVCQENPDLASSDIVQVDTPVPGSAVSSPFTVSGRIAAFEARFRIALFDAAGNIVTAVLGMSKQGQVLSPFSEEVTYLVDEETPACLWVFEDSALDGSPIHVVQLPLTLEPPPSVCQPNPDPGTSDIVEVDAPYPGDFATSPVNVSGRIAAFEATFHITIFDATGAQIVDQTGHAAQGQTLSPFSEDVVFSIRQVTPACLWVYERSPRDGSPIHVVQVPITLQP